MTITSNRPTPMSSDTDIIKSLDTSVGPSNEHDRLALEKQMKFKYRAATGELLFAMVICRPDISNAVIKLTQFNTNPAKCHYEAVIGVYKYLAATKDKGLHYWHKETCPTLPNDPLP